MRRWTKSTDFSGGLVLFVLAANSPVTGAEKEAEESQQPTSQAQQTGQREVGIEDIFAFISEGGVTTATRTERSLRTVPGAVGVVTRQQIEQMGARTVGDVLRLIPGLNVRLSPMGGVFGVRSVGSTAFTERVLLLIDGVPYNSPDKGGFAGHPAFEDFFPVEHILRLEVIKGPGSALYGQNAFQGVVNIITRNGSSLEGGEVEFVGGDQSVASVRLTQGLSRDDFRYSFTGKFKNQDGNMEFFRDSEFRTGDFYFNTSYKGLGVSYLFHRDTLESFAFAQDDPDVSPVETLPTDQNLNLLSLSFDQPLGESWSTSAKFLFNQRDGSTCAACHDSEANGTPLLDGTLASQSFIEAHEEQNRRFWFNVLMNFNPPESRHNVIFGVEYQNDRTEKQIVQRVDRDPTVENVAGFVQDEISFAGGNAIATLGVRLDDNEYTGTFVSPSVSLVVSATPSFILRGQYGRAFRQPTWNDLFINQRFQTRLNPTIAGVPTEFRRFGCVVTTTASCPAPRDAAGQPLDPQVDTEEVDTVQAGIEYFFTDAVSFKLDGYFSRYRDYIEATSFEPFGFPPFLPFPPRPPIAGPGAPAFLAFASNRSDDIDVYGSELEFRFRPASEFSGIVGYAYQTTNLDAEVDSQAAYGPEHKVTAILNYIPIPRLRVNFNLSTWSSFVGARPDLNEGLLFGEEVGEPYALADLNVSLDFWRNSDDDKFGVMFQLRNIFDEQVQTNISGGVDTSLLGIRPFVRVYYDF